MVTATWLLVVHGRRVGLREAASRIAIANAEVMNPRHEISAPTDTAQIVTLRRYYRRVRINNITVNRFRGI
jgi:hypothetical protein